MFCSPAATGASRLVAGGDRAGKGGAAARHVAVPRSPGTARTAAVRFDRATGQPSPKVQVVDLRSGATLLEVDHGAPAPLPRSASAGRAACHRRRRPRRAALARVPTAASCTSSRGPRRPDHGDRLQPPRDASRNGEHRRDRPGLGRASGQPVSVLSGHANYLDGHRVQPRRDAGRDREPRPDRADVEGRRRGRLSRPSRAARRPSPRSRSRRLGPEIVTASLDGTARNVGRRRPAVARRRRRSRRTRSRGSGSRATGSGSPRRLEIDRS